MVVNFYILIGLYILVERTIMIKILVMLIVTILLNIPTALAETESEFSDDDLPPFFSWRNIGGIDFTTSIKNQAPAPTCEAYAFISALETIVQYQVGYPFGCDLSETHLFFYSGGTCNWGVDVRDAADYLVEYGVPDEGCFPDPHRPKDTPFQSLPGWENRTVKIQKWGWVENDIESIKHALVEHGPLIICMLVRSDFMHYSGGIYKNNWGQINGGHVITIFGYNDIYRYWLIKNSWGAAWGEKGWIRVSYDAHKPMRPFFCPFYGGTGIFYVDGVYGNFMPDVPKIQIESPKRYHTYCSGCEFKTVFKKMPFVQKGGVPRIIGWTTVKINATNTNKVEFYVDDEIQFTDEEAPYEWKLHAPHGSHTLEALAYNEHNTSKGIMDFFVII